MANKTIKNYVLDTNVVLSDPRAIYAFAEHNVIIPLPVLEELEGFKKGQAERNHQARAFFRELEKFEEQYPALKNSGYPLEKGGNLIFKKVAPQQKRVNEFEANTVDHQLLDLVISMRDSENKADKHVVLVTNDVALRTKARILNLPVEPYKNAQVADTEKLYGEIEEIKVSDEELSDFYQGIDLDIDSLASLPLNTPVCLIHKHEDKRTEILCLKTAEGLVQIRRNDDVFSIKARNTEQMFALHALLDPKIPIVALTGAAGTGKTLLTLAATLKMLKAKDYQKAMIARPMVELSDKTMGFLPGTVEEKIDPYFGPIYDNLEFLRSLKPEKSKKKDKNKENLESTESASQLALKAWMRENNLELFSINFSRGRSLPNSLIIIDEAQNTTPQEMKTILTRLGEGSKAIVVGDISQIDNPYLGQRSNGLAHLIDAFKGREEFFHIHLKQGERSKIATLASELL